MAADKEHAHELIERLAPIQIPAAVGMLEDLLDPVSRRSPTPRELRFRQIDCIHCWDPNEALRP
jgi:hypothetical protein